MISDHFNSSIKQQNNSFGPLKDYSTSISLSLVILSSHLAIYQKIAYRCYRTIYKLLAKDSIPLTIDWTVTEDKRLVK